MLQGIFLPHNIYVSKGPISRSHHYHGKSLVTPYSICIVSKCFDKNDLHYSELNADINSKGEINNNLYWHFLLWRSGVQEPKDFQYGTVEFKHSIKDPNIMILFDGPSPVMNIQVRPSRVFTSHDHQYFRQRRKIMYLVNHYLKRWNEDEIMNVVSVLRNRLGDNWYCGREEDN